MEERVGKLWHRLVTRGADDRFADAAVHLEEVSRATGIWFRAFGGDPGLQVEAATATRHGARRALLQRIAGSRTHVELTWRDARALRLPATLDVYPERGLNRDLYLWLAALAAGPLPDGSAWLVRNQLLARRVLHRYPGLRPRYRRLVAAELALRPNPAALPPDEAALERAIRAALAHPGSVAEAPPARRPHRPVHLWMHPSPPIPPVADRPAGAEQAPGEGGARRARDRRRRRAERVASPEGRGPLLPFRVESLFSWAEYVRVDRGLDEDDEEDAEQAADDMEQLSVARDQRATAKGLRFDLDLPAAAHDDLPLGPGIALPEWDCRRARLIPDHCRVQPLVAADAPPAALPERLRAPARRLRRQFETLVPAHAWLRGQPDGSELDLDAVLRHRTDRAAGHASADAGLFRDFRAAQRGLACLLLADLSMSTDAWVNNAARVIDVIRDSLFLFGEALAATRDRFALYGFSSRHRSHVRFQHVKDFDQPYDDRVRGRIDALRPGFYTRMGAAIRHAANLLEAESAEKRLLLILTDGKPNDLDHYEGRYGIEDTRMAVREARRRGLHPFCVTIDEEANDYLPHLFGTAGWLLLRRPQDLPRELPMLYARLTR